MRRSRTLHDEEPGLTLTYRGKEPAKCVLANVESVRLDEIYRSCQTSFSGWRNMVIKGDNLKVLNALRNLSDVGGEVDLVYIDPPFATGREFNGVKKEKLAYRDILKGPEFVEFLRKRFILLREVLSDRGSIYVHVDWKMAHYVRVIMDEVFGPECFVNDITRIKCNPKNFERRAYGNIKDTILFYSKSDDYVWRGSRESMMEEDILRLFPHVDEQGRRYTTTPLHAPGETENGATGKPWRDLEPPKGRHWRYPPSQLETLDKLGLIHWSSTGNPRKKLFADQAEKRGKKRQDVWEFKDPPYPRYPTEKNMDMMEIIIEASSEKGDLVLDAFCGSGTTLLASEKLGRRWIGIDNSDVAIEVTRERLKEYIGDSIPTHPFSIYEAR